MTMTRLTLSARVGADGVLHVPLGQAEANREVRVTIEPTDGPALQSPQGYLDFLQATAGAWQGGQTEQIRIGLRAYLRSMWTLFWTAFIHPFTTTVVDLSTGKRIAELSVPFDQWEASLTNGREEPVNG
jgi:hypothetical protein